MKRAVKNLWTLLPLQLLFCGWLSGQTVTRGPYLQSLGAHSIVVCWRTDIPTDSRVEFGTHPDSLTQSADSSMITTEHRVRLRNLKPRTKYFYRIGSSAQVQASDTLMYFITAPEPGSSARVRVWAMGDFGHGNEGARKVKESYQAFAAREGAADFWLWLGDNVYDDGTDQEFQTKVFSGPNGYAELFPHLPFYSTSGNHDYNSICPWQDPISQLPVLCSQDPRTHDGPYLQLIEPPIHGELGGVPSGLKLFYSFDYGDIHFISLNSELGSWNPDYDWLGVTDNDTSFISPMIEWLKADLAATTKKWKIAFWHQCPYSGQNNFTEASSFQIFCIASRLHFNPILEKYGVDLVLTGHDHNYQRSYLIHGHYYYKDSFTPDMLVDGSSGREDRGEAYVKYIDGPDAGRGTVYVVQGGSSNVNAYSPFDHPAIYYGRACDTCLGSFILDVEGDRLHGRYLAAHGEIMDEFTILKRSVTGISASLPEQNIRLTPNPAEERTLLNYQLQQTGPVLIQLFTPEGRNIFTMERTQHAGQCSEPLDLSRLTAGVYLVRVRANGFASHLRLVKL
ncbi:MAG: hypothetical protein KatS3mg031_0487 [Chitinophagales bacterium]|nr:MAG: hypothetical protein KatS3mg031_0487 [Chitinophagales bacterium]